MMRMINLLQDSKGNLLYENVDYTVNYSSERKKIGKYGVKISLIGKYKGSKTLYFNIGPKGPYISSVVSISKGFKLKWKKQTS